MTGNLRYHFPIHMANAQLKNFFQVIFQKKLKLFSIFLERLAFTYELAVYLHL